MSQSQIQHVTLVQNVTTDTDDHFTNRAKSFLEQHGVTISHLKVMGKECPDVPPEAAKPDVVMVVGGDGTFLRAARMFVHNNIPLVGINTGTLGFLTHIEAERLEHYLEMLVSGKYSLESRMMLSVKDHRDGAHQPGELGELALNDVVIKNANPSQLCTLRLYVNDVLVAIYDSDGLILSTPTGTTASTMAAGGPVISPEVEAISVTPICPHSFSAKAVVMPANKDFRIVSDTRNGNVVYALDGLECGTLAAGEAMHVVRSNLSFQMINFEHSDDDFYVLLKRKLHWSMNPRWANLEGTEDMRKDAARRHHPS